MNSPHHVVPCTRLPGNRWPAGKKPFLPVFPIKILEHAQYSPDLIEKPDLKRLPLAAGFILRQPPGSRARGFTLLEVLISIVLFGIVLSLLIGGFRFSTRAWDRSEEYATDTANLQAIHRVFRNTLGRAFPVTLGEDDESFFAFAGSENSVRFAAFLPPYPDQAGLYKVQFDIIRVQERYQLRMSREAFSPASFLKKETEEAGTTVLLETESPIAFYFLDGPADGQEPDWQSDWDTGNGYPALVRLGSADEAAGIDGWPEIVTAVEINMDSTCISPAPGGICRMEN